MDLAAINIQRGRDIGLGTLNETRKDLGLQPYTTFEQITNDAATVAAMKIAFGTPDNVDLWTGGLAEQHAKAASSGRPSRTSSRTSSSGCATAIPSTSRTRSIPPTSAW